MRVGRPRPQGDNTGAPNKKPRTPGTSDHRNRGARLLGSGVIGSTYNNNMRVRIQRVCMYVRCAKRIRPSGRQDAATACRPSESRLRGAAAVPEYLQSYELASGLAHSLASPPESFRCTSFPLIKRFAPRIKEGLLACRLRCRLPYLDPRIENGDR